MTDNKELKIKFVTEKGGVYHKDGVYLDLSEITHLADGVGIFLTSEQLASIVRKEPFWTYPDSDSDECVFTDIDEVIGEEDVGGDESFKEWVKKHG